ncbi:O-antigen ligase family protein [Lacrimispora sp.]|uniref:O-antigen ligase family protein n=1 Tax=Lacrimispora sp. TaxID=2719234 RepID=UPI0032E50567
MDKNRLKTNNIIALIYVGIILSVFPLVFNNYYFDIMIFKYKFYYITTLIFIGLIILNNTITFLLNKENNIFNKSTFGNLSLPEISIIIFIFIAIVSTLQSDYIYESFWGNEGRYSGCFTLMLYGISILYIIRYLHFKNWILYIFLFSGFLACIFGITDYFKLDILGFKVQIEPTQYNMFMSTIGNVNTYTSYVALVMAISTVLFSIEKKTWKTYLYYICMVCSFFAIIMGLSDNSYLSLLTLFGLLPLYLLKTKTGLRRFLIIITTFLLSIYCIIIINKSVPNKVLQMQGLINNLPLKGLMLLLLFMGCITVVAYVAKYLIKDKKEELPIIYRFLWGGLLLLIVGILIFILYDINISLNYEKYGALKQYLLFNDDWGTHRGFNWRIGMENYNRFPLVHKIFGSGPDTYGILTYFNDQKEMINKYNETYDSAHNEYLQYFITMGPLSLVTYIVFLVSSIICIIKKSRVNKYVVCIIFAVICYSVQAFVNISVPIVTPVMLVLLASGLAKYESSTREPKENFHQ